MIDIKNDSIKHFAFRLDADANIGTGHLMRCLAIANELARQGARCHFLSKALNLSLHDLIINQGHMVHTLGNSEDSALEVLAKLRPKWLIIDHYKLDARFESKARAFSEHILIIDDLANRPHQCDFLLDQSPLRTPEDYQPWIDSKCQLCLGSDYALVRPEFKQLRKSAVNSWRRGLICFGGADPGNITLVILQALESQKQMRDIKWTVIAGNANLHWSDLKNFTTHSQLDIVLIEQSDQMAQLMADNDFAIGAAGVMTWERACLGIPTLAIPVVSNQIFSIEAIRHFGLGETLKVSELTSTTLVSSLKRLQQKARVYLRRNQTMVDGLGIERLSRILL
jgi:UDP-2,4-diacetamido-2,4,6-trideoxy-beta-L-altropyranose hydrolase